jgi:hypothetical protein
MSRLRALGRGRQNEDRVLAGHVHQMAAPVRKLRRGNAAEVLHQFSRWRWRGPSTQSPCNSSTATRSSSISANASSPSSSASTPPPAACASRAVVECFLGIVRQRRFGTDGQAEPAEEAPAPFEQGLGPLRQGRIGRRQQQVEAELAVVELGGSGLAQLVERALCGRLGQCVVGHHPRWPAADVLAAAGQPTGQCAVQFGGRNDETGLLASLEHRIGTGQSGHGQHFAARPRPSARFVESPEV